MYLNSSLTFDAKTMQKTILTNTSSILNHFLGELREVHIQKDRARFRKNLERIGEIMAYEISKTLPFVAWDIQTPLGKKNTKKIQDTIVICSILRAGLTLHNGFLNYLDQAENGFISAFRNHPNHDAYFEIQLGYQAAPKITGKHLVLVDPMLASGQSMVAVLEKIIRTEKPKSIHLAVVLATPEGVAYLEKHLPESCHLWIADMDQDLNEQKYIVPGLGDAGDLAYGDKL